MSGTDISIEDVSKFLNSEFRLPSNITYDMKCNLLLKILDSPTLERKFKWVKDIENPITFYSIYNVIPENVLDKAIELFEYYDKDIRTFSYRDYKFLYLNVLKPLFKDKYHNHFFLACGFESQEECINITNEKLDELHPKSVDKYMNLVKDSKEQLNALNNRYLERYGKDGYKDFLCAQKSKVNSLKLMDKLCDMYYPEVLYSDTLSLSTIKINNRSYKLVVNNKQKFISINDSVGPLLDKKFITSFISSLKNKKDFIRVYINDLTYKTLVLTRNGLVKFIVYLNDKTDYSDDDYNTRVNDLIDILPYLTNSIN